MEIVKATKQDNAIIKHEIEGGEPRYYAAVRGGIAWATSSAPAFYCIFGMEHINGTAYQDQPRPEGKIILLSERQADSVIDEDRFFRLLTEDCHRFWCEEWYTSGVEGLEPSPPVQLFRKKIESMKLSAPRPSLYQAPYVEEFQDGFRLVSQFKNRLSIPSESKVHQQLTAIGPADLKDNPAERFGAFNALRYVLASFAKHEPVPGPVYQPKRTSYRARKV